ncbi:MAG: GNAT family N-acetyltransferase [Chthoniobacteraceae bacterium]
MSSSFQIVEADLSNAAHQQAVRDLTAAYALDPMGNGGPLPADSLERLIPALRAHPTTHILLAYLDGRPVGIATCFLGFSTFAARPLLNLHDLAVLPECRGRGVSRELLRAVKEKARSVGCCRVTLEVLEGNTRAKGIYEQAGFAQASAGGPAGGALFFSKETV